MKILITILLALFISSNASADVKIIFEHSDTNNLPYTMRALCIDGYKWVHTARVVTQKHKYNNHVHGGAISTSLSTTMNQFYIEKNGSAVPAKC